MHEHAPQKHALPRFSGDPTGRAAAGTGGDDSMSITPADVLELLKERATAIPSAPSGNGHVATPLQPFGDGRGPGGRCQKANKGGPGNPHGRRVAALRSALLDAVTPATLKKLVKKLTQMALAGDLDAAKLLLAYTVWKPAEATDPDKAAA